MGLGGIDLFGEATEAGLGVLRGALFEVDKGRNGGLEGPVFILSTIDAVNELLRAFEKASDIVRILKIFEVRLSFDFVAHERLAVYHDETEELGFIFLVLQAGFFSMECLQSILHCFMAKGLSGSVGWVGSGNVASSPSRIIGRGRFPWYGRHNQQLRGWCECSGQPGWGCHRCR